MQTDRSIGQENATQVPEFHQMADGMKKAIDEFEATESNFTALLNTGWEACTNFVRRHPVGTSVAVGALGLLSAYLMMPAKRNHKKSKSR